MAGPGLNEITVTTARNRSMAKFDKTERLKDDNDNIKPPKGEKPALTTAQTGTEVPEKDFSSANDREKLNGKSDQTPFDYTPKDGKLGRQIHGFGHPAHARDGKLRNSGHSGAHRIGKKK